MIKLLETRQHVDPVEAARCAKANAPVPGTLLSTKTSTVGAVRTALTAQFGTSYTAHIPGAADESVVLCLVTPPPLPTPDPKEPKALTLAFAVTADGSTFWAGGQVAPA